ncbi:MAG: DUF2304 family protein [Sulfurospirillaceae bacterium]|nr:DUF2304 family protein [Sulfurospirillaceae bacterium]
MMIIKIFLILILTIAFVVFSFSTRLKVIQKLSVITGYCVIFLFVINPQYSDQVAQIFSIKSGTDLVLYIVMSITSLINIVLYVGQKSNNRIITKIIREDAKRDAKKCN